MPEYKWVGVNNTGRKQSGKLNANNKKQAIELLTLDNITILLINRNYHWEFLGKFSEKALLAFSEQLLLLLQSGIMLFDALSLLIESDNTHKFQLILKTIQQDLNNGIRFSKALESFPYYFNHQYCKMIAAGEHSGELTQVLSLLIKKQQQQLEIKRKVKKSLFYPVIILIISMLICIGLLVFVIPQFSQIYSSFGAQLPSLTQDIIALSQLFSAHWLLFLLSTAVIILFFKKLKLKTLLFHLPFFKKAVVMQQIVQWSQLMSLALFARITLIDALTLANQSLTKSTMQYQLNRVMEAVIAGEKLHVALQYCADFPKQARHFIAIGENVDALDTMMEKVAHYYHQKFSDLLDHLSKLIEPVIMIVVASLVSALIIAMYLPVFKMGSVI